MFCRCLRPQLYAINIGTIEASADILDIEENEQFLDWRHAFEDKTQA